MKRLTRLWGLLIALPLMMTSCDWLDNPVIPNLRVTKAALTLKVGETASCRATAQRHVALTYASANPAVATVDAAGMITAVGVGTTQITVKAEGENDYYRTEIFGQASTTIDVTVIPGTTNLASLTGDYTAHDGEVLTGTLTGSYKVSIADGATVELYNVTINGGNNDTTPWAGITCLGDATITICGTNNVKGFYDEYPAIQAGPIGTTLTINGTGTLTATGSDYGSGIGSGYNNSSCGDITINGGTITASSGTSGAGIGSGYYQSSCGDITINGGTITASSGTDGAGIGSGFYYSSCGAINISGGTVTASSGDYGAGIGSGDAYASCGAINIKGGSITASSNDGAGIGSGYNNSSCGNITINGGTINASSGTDGAGIGSGYNDSSCGAITISGGTVTASSGGKGAGIGGGYTSRFTSLTITAGITQVQATRNNTSAWPIGKGKNDTGSGAVTIAGATLTSNTWDGTGLTGLNFANSSTGGDNLTWTLTPVAP